MPPLFDLHSWQAAAVPALAVLGAVAGVWCSRSARAYARLLRAGAHPDAACLLAALGMGLGRRRSVRGGGPALPRRSLRRLRSDAAGALILAVAFPMAAAAFGYSPRAFCFAMACAMLMLLAFIDARARLLPDALTLPLLWLGLAAAWQGWGAISLHDAVAGAMAGYGVLWLLLQGFRLLRGLEGMGFGDLKLLSALGAWLGWQALPWVLLSACAGGIVFAMLRQKTLLPSGAYPFGPFLAAAGAGVFIAGAGLHLCFC